MISAPVTGRTVIAYWLIPGEPAYSCFQQIIKDLAGRYDAPVFEPHLTIHVAGDDVRAARQRLAGVIRKIGVIRLKPLRISHSEKFTKALFLEFVTTNELLQSNEMIRESVEDSFQYDLKPHLSLLYAKISLATRRKLTAAIAIPFLEIAFDTIKAVRCVSPTQTKADVEAWRSISVNTLC